MFGRTTPTNATDAIALIEAAGEGKTNWVEAREDVLKLFAEFPEELKGDAHVCEKALARFSGFCGDVLEMFTMFSETVRKNVDIQGLMIDMLKIPCHSSSQGPFLAQILDGSKDDAATVHRCCSTWKHLWQVKDVLRRLPDALKADIEFQTQFVRDVDLGHDATEILHVFPARKYDISFCTLLVEKCGVERRSGGIGNHHTDGSSVPTLYLQFSEQIKRNTDMQKRVFEKCSSFGMPMLFRVWPRELQGDPSVRGEFLNKCDDKARADLFKAFVQALPSEIPSDVDLQRRFVETTGESRLHEVFAGLPDSSKNNLDLVKACIDNPKLTSDYWLGCLFEAFPYGVKYDPQVQLRCLDKCSSEASREELRKKLPRGRILSSSVSISHYPHVGGTSTHQAQPLTQRGQGVSAGGSQPQMYGQMYMGSGPVQVSGGRMPQQSQLHQQQQQQQQRSQQLPQPPQQQGLLGFAPQVSMAGCPQQGPVMLVSAGQGGGQRGMNTVSTVAMPKMSGPPQQMTVMQGQGPQGQTQQQTTYVRVVPGQGGYFPQR